MPCKSDHMDPTGLEREASRVACLLDELNGAKPSQGSWYGYHPRVYNQVSQELADKLTAELCSRLQTVDVTKYSLELQMWWRDHQAADKARVERELEQSRTAAEREAALAKLTPHERKLLGF